MSDLVSQALYYGPDENSGVPIKAWMKGVTLEDKAFQQLKNTASLPIVHPYLAVMPDAHFGMGATVGSVVPTKGAIIPAAVGVDIGCGMTFGLTRLTRADLPEDLVDLRLAIEARIPHGRTNNGGEGDKGVHAKLDRDSARAEVWGLLRERLNAIVAKHPELKRHAVRAPSHLGTLGTGNHFIELSVDTTDRVWFVIHSGSRGIGNGIGTYFIKKAKEVCKTEGIDLVDKDLAYLKEGTALFDDYVEAVTWAQDFAKANRRLMRSALLDVLMERYEGVISPLSIVYPAYDCHHNYVTKETHFGEELWITRKGAVSAQLDEIGIIPGSMGAKTFIVRGRGNPESFCTCSHGAGRIMSRGEAKRTFTLADHAAATEGVECRKDSEVIDETPAAYKPIDAVMAAQSDLVEIQEVLKQVLCVKG